MLKIGDFSRLSQVSVKALRYYDEIGLLAPAHIDPFTNYRYYSVDQLPRLNRILALKDLGLSLDEIARLVAQDLTPAQIEELLRRKQAEIERTLAEEQARLARVAARLRQIEREGRLPEHEVVIKPVEALRVAAARTVIAHYGAAGPLFEALSAFLAAAGLDPAACYPWLSLYHDPGYRDREVDTTVAAPVGRALPDADRVRVIELPAVATMACVVHRGPYEDLGGAYRALMGYLQANGLTISGPNRQLYLHGPNQDTAPGDYVTEVQFPVQPADAPTPRAPQN